MKVVLITGSSRGIGRGIALELAKSDVTVAVHYKSNREAALEAAAAVSDDPETALFQADLAVAEDRERLLAEVLSRFGRIDGLVNNAGIAPRSRDDIVDADPTVFREVIATNLEGPYFLSSRVARHWLDHPVKTRRYLVFVTSVSAQMASTNRGDYCISKAGLAMASTLFATRLAEHGVTVCEVRPGIIATDMTSGVKERYDLRIAEGLVPQRRWGTPEDVGKAVCSVITGAFDFSTGSVIHVDGGLHVQEL